MRPGANGTWTSWPAASGARAAGADGDRALVACGFGRLLDGGAPAEHDQVGQRDLLAPGLGGLPRLLDPLQGAQHLCQLVGVVDLPVALGFEADARPVRPAALVAVAER